MAIAVTENAARQIRDQLAKRGRGVGLRFPTQVATELQFSRDHVTAFQPRGLPATREWVQLNRADPADYAKDLELFRESIAFVKKGRR